MNFQNIEEIKQFLEKLGFTETETNRWQKQYEKHDNYVIKIEFNENNPAKSLIYYNPKRSTTQASIPKPTGEILLGDLTTSNFENPENFVVLEAVNRLLDIGYKPENIHLERKWKLGRTGKSGKADITVYKPLDKENAEGERLRTFMIVECKTWGEEFEKEKIRLFKNGGQLFSYFQQEKDTDVLVLYASTFEEGEITYDNVIIRVDDNGEEMQRLIEDCRQKNKENEEIPCSFSEATSVPELVDVWKRVFNQFVFKHGIFEPDAGLYNLDLKPLKKKDLVPLKSSQGLFNAFAEILRHNNISDNANAFNKMMSLFLCKIVDEEKKNEDDILDFQVKFGESFENLVDRLQQLYKIGMEEYLGVKDFVYFSDEDIRKNIKLYPERTPLEELEDIFRQIKYYTNNEFAFKEVHNKKLFYQNALILSEIIELLQRYKMKYSHKNQILGDFFELLLNHGVKQSEGQFFTPLPIVRFMVISVGIDKFIEKKHTQNITKEPLPKILDYACGVAHFLTEAIDEINKVIDTKKINVAQHWEGRSIYGIEKDYRLARTAKIACFLNGDGSANIIFGDGLDDYGKLDLETKKFDFILTNPPYSVKSFKKYLDVKPNYELLQYLTENSSEIEVLFIERAKQVLDEEGGRIAIILPSSILSNTSVYTKARELILKYFEIKAIAEFGSQTFIATGTNTVVLFLERRGDWFAIDRERIAEEIFDQKVIKRNDYVDIEKLFTNFITYRDLPLDDYKKFVLEDILTEKLNNTELFQTYRDWFNNLTEVKNLRKKQERLEKEIDLLYSKLNKASDDKAKEKIQKQIERKENDLEKVNELLDNDILFKEKIREKEKEKFFYFSLLFKYGTEYGQKQWYEFQQTVIARAPAKTDQQKQYLGYEFNKRRGFEGIEIYKDENGKPTTKLYDEENYYNPTKIASYIRKNFENENIDQIHDEVKEYLNVYSLPDLFDFERAEFEKQINLSAKKKIIIQSKWEVQKLGEAVEVIIGGTPSRKEPKYWVGGTNPWVSVSELNGNIIYDTKEKITDLGVKQSNVKLIPEGTTLVSFKLSIGKTGFTGINLYTNEAIAALIPKKGILNKFIFYIFKYDYIHLEAIENKAFGKSLNSDFLKKQVQIPVPPLDVQQKIVSEIETLEKEEENNRETIEKLRNEIEEKVNSIFEGTYKLKRLKDITTIYNGGTPNTKRPEYWNGNIPWITLEDIKGKYIYDTKRKISELGLKHSNAKLLPINTVVFSSRATIGTVAITKIELATNQGFKNFVCNPEILHYEFLYYILVHQAKFIENLASGMKYKEISKQIIEQYKIPVPPLDVQKQIVAELESLELEIDKLENRNKEIEEEKKKVLEKYL